MKENINIEKYIEDYEKGTLLINQIARLEHSNYNTIDYCINKYYQKIGKERVKPKIKNIGEKNRKNIDIEKYIKDYESGKISIPEIAQIEDVHPNTINSRVNEYYEKKGKKRCDIIRKIN